MEHTNQIIEDMLRMYVMENQLSGGAILRIAPPVRGGSLAAKGAELCSLLPFLFSASLGAILHKEQKLVYFFGNCPLTGSDGHEIE